jgi:hypothetical protein
LRTKFFDPLVAVFTDNPDEWETGSWIWASAMLVIFLLLMFCVCSTFCSKKKKGRGRPRSDDNSQRNPRRSGNARPRRGEYYD